jgi:tRNA-dependent cyclodipeptide synthase
MKIENCYNCNTKDIESKKFNIVIGISLGNKWFSKENLTEYIKWALENTKKGVLILIADSNHAINYEVFRDYDKDKALNTALNEGRKKEKIIKRIIHNLPKETHSMINIAKWDDVRKSEYYISKIKIIRKEFSENKEFYHFVMKMIKENLGERIEKFSKEKREKLADYILDEIPILLKTEYKGEIYNLLPYPKDTLLNKLFVGLQNETLFEELAQKLEIEYKSAYITAIPN